MFSLLSGLVKWLFEREETNVLIVGVDNAGKTTLLEQMKGLYRKATPIPPEKIPPTVGMNMAKIDVGSRRAVFWDLGGQAAMRSVWNHYIPDANAVLFVVDAADPSRLDEAVEAYRALSTHPQLEGVPIMVFANKQDLKEAADERTLAKRFEDPEGAARQMKCLGVSALSCEGVHEGISWLLDHGVTREVV